MECSPREQGYCLEHKVGYTQGREGGDESP